MTAVHAEFHGNGVLQIGQQSSSLRNRVWCLAGERHGFNHKFLQAVRTCVIQQLEHIRTQSLESFLAFHWIVRIAHAHATERTADSSGAQFGGGFDGSTLPKFRGLAAFGQRMQEVVVVVTGQPKKRTVNLNPSRFGSFAV